MPDVSNTPASIQPTTTDKLVGAGTFLATNGATIMAPVMPGVHQDLGGAAVSSFALFINAVIQQLKRHSWFEQDRIAIWTGVILAGYLCVGIWLIGSNNGQAALINFTNVVGLVLTNYGSMSKTGVISSSNTAVSPAVDAVPQTDIVKP